MIVYGAANVAMGKPAFPSASPIAAALIGTAVHLWYLPFIFMILAMMDLVARRIRRSILFWISTTSGAVILASAAEWRPLIDAYPPFSQWAHAAAAVFAGVALGLAPRLGKVAWAGGALVLGGLAVAIGQSVDGVGTPYAIALIATTAAVYIGERYPAPFSVQGLADCMLGVYLLHLLTLPVASRLVGMHTLEAVTLAFTMALTVTWVARRWVPSARLVLG